MLTKNHSVMPEKLKGSQLALEIRFREKRESRRGGEKGKEKRMRKKRERGIKEEVIKMILECLVLVKRC